MADYKDDYYGEVDNTFADLKRHPFTEQGRLLQPLVQEGQPNGPQGWVENASGTDGEPTVTVDADGLHVTAGDIGSSAGTTIDTDGILVEDSALQERVRLGKLSASTYGLRVTNDSGTVIIDGSSNMFKIQATGTTSVVCAANTAASTTVTLTALGALSATPAHLSTISNGNTNTANQHLGFFYAGKSAPRYVAPVSGGAANYAVIVLESGIAEVHTALNGSSEATVIIAGQTGSAMTFYSRYYVLEEAAL